MLNRFGKSNKGYIAGKGAFYSRKLDRMYMKIEAEIRDIYLAQPPRRRCVVCDGKLTGSRFTIRKVLYSLCPGCGHFNGMHEDTDTFVRHVYNLESRGNDGAYMDASVKIFDARVREIYRPKVDFMVDALLAGGEEPHRLRYADIGAGAGHFVKAMRDAGLANSIGYETSTVLVESTNKLLGARLLQANDIEKVGQMVAAIDVDVLTMIFSLEHVRNLRKFVARVRENKRIKWFYFAVPMFNPSIMLETLFTRRMTRSIGRGHTHLFTKSSIEKFCADNSFAVEAAWWFGGNGFDFHRLVSASLAANPQTHPLAAQWDGMMAKVIDPLQLAFDKAHMSSEVHMLAKVR